MKKIPLIILAVLLAFPAWASQNATTLPTVSPYPGLTMLNNINSSFDTFQTNFAGASAPSTSPAPEAYQYWADTTNNLLKLYNGTTWLPMGKFASSQWVPISNGVPFTIPASTGSSNAYVVTYAPVPSALVTGQHYPFIANFANTAAATLNINSIGAKAIKKQGGTALVSGDIVNGAVVDTVYDGTNMQMLSQVGNSSAGGITSIATSGLVTGGTITTSGTISLATIPAYGVAANPTGSSAVPVGTTLTALMDSAFDNTQGDILYRGASLWSVLTPGTNGQALLSGGASANPSWGTVSAFSTQSANLSGSRSLGSVYRNTSGKTMLVEVFVTNTTTLQNYDAYTDSSTTPTTLVGGALVAGSGGGGNTTTLVFMVLNNNYYKVTADNAGASTINSWIELN